MINHWINYRLKWGQSVFLAGVMALAACGEETDDKEETIAKLKILAIRAESPDMHPGDVTQVKVLLGAPGAISVTTVIFPIALADARSFVPGSGSVNERTSGGAAAGVAFNYLGDTTIPVPPVAPWMAIAGEAAPAYASVFYQAPVTPGAYSLAAFVTAEKVTISDIRKQDRINGLLAGSLKALKTVRVIPVGQPLNKNPEIRSLVVEKRWARESKKNSEKESPLKPDGFRVRPNEVIRVKANVKDEDPKRPSALWWITGGKVNGYGRRDIDWVAPEEPGIETLICVVLDREGGTAWSMVDVRVGDPSPVRIAVSDKGKIDSKKAPDRLRDAVSKDAKVVPLVSSGGRMLWLGFANAASATTTLGGLADGKAVLVSGTLIPDKHSRLGWFLNAPVFEGYAEDTTLPVPTAGDINSVPPKAIQVTLKIDGLITRP